MNNVKLAVALGAGYVLGRLRKARWALALAGMAAGKKISTDPKVLLGQVLESPQLLELTDGIRGGLAEAGKKAAVAAVSNRIEGLTDQMQRRTESLRDRAPHGEEESDEEPEQHRDERNQRDSRDERDDSAPRSRKSSRAGKTGGSDETSGTAGQKRSRASASASESGPSRSPVSGRFTRSRSGGGGSSSRPAAKKTSAKKTTAGTSAPKKTSVKKTTSSSSTRKASPGSSRASSSKRASSRSRSE